MTVTADEQQINLDVPRDFHEVPLDDAVEDRAAAQTRLLDELGITDRSQREGLAGYLEAVARRTRGGAVVGTSFCAVQLAGSPSTATLTVGTEPMATDDPLVFALGAAEWLRRQNRYEHVGLDRVGATTAVIARRTAPPGDGPTHQVTVVVPLSGQGVFVTVATDDADQLPAYEQVARTAAASARRVR